jgi:hypothetical protein
VFWNYELDRWIIEEEGWQDLVAKGFDPQRHFAAFLHTLRWNCVTATDSSADPDPAGIGHIIPTWSGSSMTLQRTWGACLIIATAFHQSLFVLHTGQAYLVT